MFSRSVFFLLLISNFSFSQLSVRNDAYVFINDEVVFVEDDINLNETNSSMYLRNEAQVIQGTGVTGNSGVGELSVYQEGNVGEYEYNYWCSPIGSKTSNNVNNPFGVTFLNDVTGLITSTPATVTHLPGYNGTSSPLVIEDYWIWKYIASDEYSEWQHVRGATSLNPGEGFTMKGTVGSGDAQRYDFRGKPNNGTISVSVDNNQLSLVGNPYPSALDALAYIHDPQNAAVITGTLQYWEQDPSVNSHHLNNYEGGYATYTINAAGTVETSISAVFNTYNNDGSINVAGTGTGSKTPRRYIPIGQGFMVEGTALGVVRAKNSHRIYIKETHVDSEFFKNSDPKNKAKKTTDGFSKVPSDYKRFRLNVDFNDTYTRQLVETFHGSATDGFDYGLESKINEGEILASDALWSIDGKPYLAEALPFDPTLRIPLTIKVNKETPIRIRIADIQNFESDQAIYVHDIENNTFVDLKSQDFNINLDTGNYTDRFKIVFEKNSLSTTEANLEDLRVFQNNAIAQLKISNPNALNIKAFSLFDVAGKQVLNKRVLDSKKAYTHSTKSLSDGMYIVQINLDNNQVFNKKIIIANKN
ncbi:T9SS type A sorting domain-containing protein [Flavivirga spongiicola]|uniref:T9SS type A sorting domain-containing protein n=1 Tax=Flavivirga spongiicola TaxID=421621 RepID=A0ABU7XMJ3_9FLAO|nr:T9SS type A sorting domain-containing protein [Flavivirga sp. MEBiC05379]MDO5981322.1 T9SS type A sorting domain-containing protein [Flavivirga sp. MEBiC05379]